MLQGRETTKSKAEKDTFNWIYYIFNDHGQGCSSYRPSCMSTLLLKVVSGWWDCETNLILDKHLMSSLHCCVIYRHDPQNWNFTSFQFTVNGDSGDIIHTTWCLMEVKYVNTMEVHSVHVCNCKKKRSFILLVWCHSTVWTTRQSSLTRNSIVNTMLSAKNPVLPPSQKPLSC